MVRRSGWSHEDGAIANERYEWYTPAYIFNALNLEFDLDPCSPGADKCLVPAKNHIMLPDNGLTSDWNKSLVFCNPPYGTYTADWMRKCADNNNSIALVFARTSTKWFKEIYKSVDVICFISSRVKFISGETGQPAGSPGADSMLIGWGSTARNAIMQSNLGACFIPVGDSNG